MEILKICSALFFTHAVIALVSFSVGMQYEFSYEFKKKDAPVIEVQPEKKDISFLTESVNE